MPAMAPPPTSAEIARLYAPLALRRGPALPNRFVLAPMTNQQSAEDGELGDDELHWLRLRAQGGFGHVVTCACHVAEEGKGFPGELAIYSDRHLPGLTRLATALRAAGAVSSVQLYHGGLRSITRDLVAPSDDTTTGARALTAAQVAATIASFVRAARRAEQAGFDGVQLHAAHGYLLSQFLSPQFNRRTDAYGGCADRRARFLREIIDGIRAATGPHFQLHVRLSPERFGQELGEVIALVERLLAGDHVDSIDLSVWDVRKEPEDERFRGRSLLSYFTLLERRGVRLGAAGGIIQPRDAVDALEAGLDFVTLGKVSILHPDYPNRLRENAAFTPAWLPVSAAHLRHAGLGEGFIRYLSSWTNFVSDLKAPLDAPRFDIGEYLKKGAAAK